MESQKTQNELVGGELTDAQLEAVVAGKSMLGKSPPVTIGPFPSRRSVATGVPSVSPAPAATGGCVGGVCRKA
jgi:hypothetical protein